MAKINPIRVRPEMKIRVLGDEDLDLIHQAVLTILEEVGVRYPLQRALEIFAEAGARVDFNNHIVKIPSDLLMDTISKAPRAFTMASRGEPNLDLFLDGTKTYIGTDGTGLTTVDLKTRKRRPSTKDDVSMMALIVDCLESVSFFWPLVSARDVPPEVMALHEIEASVKNTEKHIEIITCTNPKAARYAIEMARVIAGGSKAMKERSVISLGNAAISPLTHDEKGLEVLLAFAEAGIPVSSGTMPTVGSTAPASIAAALALGAAEILSGVCLVQLAYPGAPVLYSFLPEMLNPITGGILASGIQKPLLYAAGVQIGHYYGLPVRSYYGGTDSHVPGCWQTGKDNAIDAFSICMAGPDIVPAMGLLEAYTLLYPEKILLDDEIFQSVKHITEGIKIDFDSLGIDELLSVGPGGHFLDRDYTVKNIRKLWHSGISHQWSSQKDDFRDPQDAAMEKVQWILKNHRPKPLDKKVEEELKRIINSAEKELVFGRSENGLT
jgi:trimethylamine--corrinoid protein Co-methyltransferase